MKVTSELRQSLESYASIDSCVLQRNIAKLDTAFSNFWQHGRGFPQFIPRLNSFEYKPGRVILRHIRKNYATAYLPGIGEVKFHNSRDLSLIQDLSFRDGECQKGAVKSMRRFLTEVGIKNDEV